MTGRIHLVGCGPGPADLLTVRAAKVIAGADLLLHDRLVSEEVLALKRPGARSLCVGKRAHERGCEVGYVARLMIREAAAGLSVVRLHGGDPSLFGRLAEELSLLRRAKPRVEIVPGISAAFAAAAALQVPLTRREVASSVVFSAGSNPQATAAAALTPSSTLAFYMAGRRAPAIARQLLACGKPADTPAVLVASVGGADERALRCDLARLARKRPLAHEGPVLLLVGEVLRSEGVQEVLRGEAGSRFERRGVPDDLGPGAPRARAASARSGARGHRRSGQAGH